MSKTETYTQYAAFCKKSNGHWVKLHAFYYKTPSEAERAIASQKEISPDFQYKIMARKVTMTREKWSDFCER